MKITYGSVPERPKGADCKSVVSDFGGPNPPAPTKIRKLCFRIFPFGNTERVDSEGRPCRRQGKRQPGGLSLARGLPHCFRSVRARVDVRAIHPLPPKSESYAFGFFLSVTQSGWIRKGGLAAGKVNDSPWTSTLFSVGSSEGRCKSYHKIRKAALLIFLM